MLAHMGVDAESGLVHTVVGTAANVGDVSQTEQFLLGDEKTVYLDAAKLRHPDSCPATRVSSFTSLSLPSPWRVKCLFSGMCREVGVAPSVVSAAV